MYYAKMILSNLLSSKDEILSDPNDGPMQMPDENMTALSVKDLGCDFENVFYFSDQKERATANSVDIEMSSTTK
ncbi:hypothetical protein SLA2020_169390 [Shorea laevis]